MLTTPTTFVLGAGSHVPYKMLTGQGLTARIISLLPTPSTAGNSARVHPFLGTFYAIHGTDTRIAKAATDFRHKLNLGLHTSIDSFLRTYREVKFFPEIGKLAVAMILRPIEFQMTWARGLESDWLTYLFQALHKGCHKSIDDFIEGNKNVQFVTFNYDRTLEHFMTVKLSNSYGLSREAAWEKVKAWDNIIHVYGSLGSFSVEELDTKFMPDDPDSYREAANSIRLMYDDRQEEKLATKAQDLIRGAQTVIFLGFAFDVDNIARLNLNKTCDGKSILAATRLGMTDMEWHRAIRDMSPAQFMAGVGEDDDCLAFFRNANVL